MLTVKRGQRRSDANQHTDGDKQQNDQDQRNLPLGTEKETQDDYIVIFDGKAEKQQEQEEPEGPDESAHARNYP